MCLSIPAKIISIENGIAKADVGGTVVEAGLHLVNDANVGDYILIHTGFALQKISEQEALETFQLIKELNDSYEQ